MAPPKRRSSIGLTLGATGAHNELIATIWLLRQGYEVLRNVSPHGPVDIVGIKDGVVHLFDVKAREPKRNGEKIPAVRLTDQQIALGVKGLAVFSDGTCQIDLEPQRRYQMRQCLTCKQEFQIVRYDQKFCGHQCRPSAVLRASEREALRRKIEGNCVDEERETP